MRKKKRRKSRKWERKKENKKSKLLRKRPVSSSKIDLTA